MLFRRPRHRRWIALIALLGLLFQQVAMAAYACPLDHSELAAPATDAAMTSCSHPDPADPRCQQHCHPLVASSDHGAPPSVPPAILPPTTWQRTACWVPHSWHDDIAREVVARATAPPLNIQHCTFQI